jgi:hypothetical protein
MSEITFNIVTSIKYGTHRSLRSEGESRRDLLLSNIDMLLKEFVIPDFLIINYRPIPLRRKMLGAAWLDGEIAIIDIEARQDDESFFSTLFHEMTHIEQFVTEKLCALDDEPERGYLWEGVEHVRLKTTDDSYDDQPWEAEANLKAERIMKKFNMNLNFKKFLNE